jgi:hypothetical protein
VLIHHELPPSLTALRIRPVTYRVRRDPAAGRYITIEWSSCSDRPTRMTVERCGPEGFAPEPAAARYFRSSGPDQSQL